MYARVILNLIQNLPMTVRHQKARHAAQIPPLLSG